MPEADLPPGEREDRPLRLRVRAPQRAQEGDLLHQGQHHEDDGRPLPPRLRRARRRLPRARQGALDRRHRRRQARRLARDLRRDRDAEPLRRHPLRRRRPDRRLGRPRRLGQHRRPGGDVRGDPRLGAAPRRPEPRQPVRAAARRHPDARPHRPDRRSPSASTTPGCARSRTGSTPTTSSTRESRRRRSARGSSARRSSRDSASVRRSSPRSRTRRRPASSRGSPCARRRR